MEISQSGNTVRSAGRMAVARSRQKAGRARGCVGQIPAVLDVRVDPWNRNADATDLPLEQDPSGFVNAVPNLLAQPLKIGRGGGTGIDQEVGVLL